MSNVVWTSNALAQLSSIYEYISRDSERYAKRMVDRITARSKQIETFPAKNASTQIENFDKLCGTLAVMQLTDAVVVRAASIYGELRRTGKPTGDADILIAATALENGCEIVTNNTSHFSPIEGLVVSCDRSAVEC